MNQVNYTPEQLLYMIVMLFSACGLLVLVVEGITFYMEGRSYRREK